MLINLTGLTILTPNGVIEPDELFEPVVVIYQTRPAALLDGVALVHVESATLSNEIWECQGDTYIVTPEVGALLSGRSDIIVPIVERDLNDGYISVTRFRPA